MESESSQETESHGQCNQPPDLATFTTAAAVRRSCFANSPLGWEAIQDDRRVTSILWNTAFPWRRPFSAREDSSPLVAFLSS